MSVSESIYYRRQHITGPSCVLVSIKFGVTPENGVLVVKRVALSQDDAELRIDLDRHKEEILEGVQEANIKYGGSLQVQEIEVVPNDYPKEGQARYAAFKIAEHVLSKNI